MTVTADERTAIAREVTSGRLLSDVARDLACWCPEGEPCHADVLLAIANPEEARRG